MKNKNTKAHIPFQIVEDGKCIWKKITKIVSIQDDNTVCPICNRILITGDTLIPLRKTKKALVKGLFCPQCRCLYAHHSSDIKRLLKDNLRAKEFTLNGQAFWNYTAIKKIQIAKEKARKIRQSKITMLKGVENAIVLIPIQFSDSGIIDIVIVNDKKIQNTTCNIYHYSSVEAREVLSAAFAPKREGNGYFCGKTFRVLSKFIVYADDRAKEMPYYLLPNDLCLKSGGGFHSEIKNNLKEIVDVLLYSPYTKRYEILHVTHDKQECSYYVDFGVYRYFVECFGNPEISYCFSYSGGYTREWTDLNSESILKTCGYTTEKADDLSNTERQSILADLIDLNICSSSRIMYFLDFFIATHPQDSYIPNRSKWTTDKVFVLNYRANPVRFLIMKQ